MKQRTASGAPERLRPKITPTARPFWDALREHRVVVQRCTSCSAWIHYPRMICPYCGSAELAFAEVAGTGSIHTYTIARQPTTPHFEADVPQIIAIVELDEGPRLTTTLVVDAIDDLKAGMRVQPVFDDHDGITLLRFKLA